jgi:hypothetical protein
MIIDQQNAKCIHTFPIDQQTYQSKHDAVCATLLTLRGAGARVMQAAAGSGAVWLTHWAG